jgi:hypothetical protein
MSYQRVTAHYLILLKNLPLVTRPSAPLYALVLTIMAISGLGGTGNIGDSDGNRAPTASSEGCEIFSSPIDMPVLEVHADANITTEAKGHIAALAALEYWDLTTGNTAAKPLSVIITNG